MAVNHESVSDKQIKGILTYINGLKHNKEQVRMMFLCSILGGMRSINFRNLQVFDVYKSDGSVKESIDLKAGKNKGSKFSATYYINDQLKKEFEHYYKFLQKKYGERLSEENFLFLSQKNKPYNPKSIYRIFRNLWYDQKEIDGATHMGRHVYISKLIDQGINPFIVQKLVNHRSIQTTQRYYNADPRRLMTAVNTLKF